MYFVYLVGPIIVYEYCEHGTLKDYLDQQQNNRNIELQELLFRFGLDIAKGMQYVASKGVLVITVFIKSDS